METQLTIRSILAGMVPPKDEAIRLLKIWGTIFALLAAEVLLNSIERGALPEIQYLVLLGTEAAIFTAILDFADLAVRDSR